MKDYVVLQKSLEEKLLKALGHLNYSFKKVENLSPTIKELDEESLEVWESFSARFSRVCDIFLNRYLRLIVLKEDPGFSGTLRDFLNMGEKIGIIKSALEWLSLRELRNIAAHEYSDKDQEIFFNNLRTLCPKLLELYKLLDKDKDETIKR